MIVASVADGLVASASRKDYAEAAAVVLTENGDHVGKVNELSGDVAWNYHELASTITEIVGRDVVYTRSAPEHVLILVEYGPRRGHGRIRRGARGRHPRRPFC